MKVSLLNLLRVALGICFICLVYQILDKINADGHLWMTFFLYLLGTLVGVILARVEGEKV